MKIFFLFLAVLGAAASTAPAAAPPSAAPESSVPSAIVGTWRLLRFEDTDPQGRVTRRYGNRPKGYIVYDATGHLNVNLMRDPPARPFASGDDTVGTDAEIREAYDAYVAYFGTYRVDWSRKLVTHIVEGSLWPSYVGTEQPRPFRLEGDKLVLEGKSADGSSYVREFERVR